MKRIVISKLERDHHHMVVNAGMHEVIVYLAEKHNTTITDMTYRILKEGLRRYIPKQ
jgi:hypothetical protein